MRRYNAHRNSYDVAIIGAGIGGLTAGAFLAKAGLSVCILEKEGTVGGYLQGFRRHDFRFDTAIHWLNQTSPGGLLDHVFEALGQDHPRPKTQQRIKRFKGEYCDYLLTNHPELFMEQLIRDYPHEEAGIRRFFADANKLSEAFTFYRFVFRCDETMNFWERWRNKLARIKFVRYFLPYIFYSGEKGLKKGLSKYFRDEKLQHFFATNHDLLSCLIPISWAYINDFQVPPEGGGQRIPEWLEHVSRNYGADIFVRSPVKEVLVENGAVRGLRFTQHGQTHTIEARHVIASCDVETLYERMLPEQAVPAKLKQNLRNAELYASSVTVFVALSCPAEALGFGEEGIQLIDEKLSYQDLQSGDPRLSEIQILSPSARDKSMAPAGQGTLTLFMPAFMDYKDQWMTTPQGDDPYGRGDAYYALKREVAEIIIDRVSQRLCPNLREHILFYEVATPVTHYRYTGNRDGTMMGARPGKKNYQLGIAHYRTEVKNLILGGHWAEIGGGVPIAAKAGCNAALLVLKSEQPKAFRVLCDYVDHKISLADFNATGLFQPHKVPWVPKPTPAARRERKE